MCSSYYITSKMNGFVLQPDGGNPLSSTRVCPMKRNGDICQQWRDDPTTRTIRNMLNGYCMDIEGGTLVLKPYEKCKESQLWERKDNMIANRIHSNIVVDIQTPDKGERGNVYSWPFWNGPNQLWTFDSV